MGIQGLNYREDSDLSFLELCKNSDLEILVRILVYGKDGEKRLNQELSQEKRFTEAGENYSKVWDLIAAEYQHFGADSLASFFRGGKGVLHREILTDACNKLKVNYNKKAEISTIENNLLLKIIEGSLEKMTEEEKREFASGMNINPANLTSTAIMSALQIAIRSGGFASYKIALIVANSVSKALIGRGLSLTLNAGLTRWIGIFTGPIGWGITTILTIPMISGPAYRVTIPSVIQIAYMRQRLLNKDNLELL
jgi:uncharacterized protein YaaW (UPF0174 family)